MYHYIVYLNLSFISLVSPFALFVFTVAQYDLNITDVSWYHTRAVEEEDASSIILPLALAGLAVLLILIGCLGALFYIKKR